MSSVSPRLVAIVVPLSALLLFGLSHLLLRNGLAPADWTCSGGMVVRLVAETGAARTALVLTDPDGGTATIEVPTFRLRACVRAEHAARRRQAQTDLEDRTAAALFDARMALIEEIPRYFNVRYSGVRAGVRAVKDLGRTGCAGCGGCASELGRSGNPFSAVGAGLGAAWEEKGQIHRDFFEASLRKLLVPPQRILVEALATTFAEQGPHEQGLVLAVKRALSRAADRPLALSGGLALAAPMARHPSVSLDAAGGGLVLEAASLPAGELAGEAASLAVLELGHPRLPPRLLRVGALASSVIVSEIVTVVVMTELEELLFSDEVAANILAAWDEQAAAWRIAVLADYQESLAAERAELLRWVDQGSLPVQIE